MAAEEYAAYIARFDSAVGALAVGGYGKWKGKLVRKLDVAEFETRQLEYLRLAEFYTRTLERGDTMNDAITKLLRERQADLILEEES